MATNAPNDNLDTVIRTVFTVDGDAKVEAALNRARSRVRQYYTDIEKRARETATTTQLVNKALLDIDRQNALVKIRRDFAEAAKSGKDFKAALEDVTSQLEAVSASQAEVNQVIAAGAAATGGGRGAALRTLGREARLAVPAIPIPGTGVSSEAGFRLLEIGGRLTSVFENLSPAMKTATVAGAAFTAGLVAIGIAYNNLNEGFARQTRAIIAGQEAFTRLRLHGTQEEVNAAIEQQRIEQEIAQARIDENKRLLSGLEEQAGPVAAALADVFNIGGVQELRKATQELEQQQADSALAESRLASLRTDTAFQTRIAAEAEAKLQMERLGLLAQNARFEVEAAQFARTATVEAFDERKQQLEFERDRLAAIAEELYRLGGATNVPKELADRVDDLTHQLFFFNDALRESIAVTQQAAEAANYLKQQRADIADSEQKFQDDIGKLETDAANKRIAINEKLQDSLVKAAEDAAQRSEDALNKLIEKRADIGTDLGRDFNEEEIKLQEDRLDALIDFQRDEAKAERAHADTIKRIRNQSRLDESDAIQNRDAIALDRARARTTEQIRDEQDRFASEKREREIALRDQQSDLATAFRRDREQRLRKYDQDITDASIAYQRELGQIALQRQRREQELQAQHNRELYQLQQQFTRKQQLLIKEHNAELQLLSRSASARIRIEQQTQQALIDAANRRLQAAGRSQFNSNIPLGLSRGFGGIGPYSGLAGGGELLAGQTALVNELRRESFSSRGRTIALPEGMGFFTPTQSGRVNPNGGASQIALRLEGAQQRTIEITSRQQAMQVFDEVLTQAGVA